jgi:hypothetical protein
MCTENLCQKINKDLDGILSGLFLFFFAVFIFAISIYKKNYLLLILSIISGIIGISFIIWLCTTLCKKEKETSEISEPLVVKNVNNTV